jgi:hypothetical protein
MEVVSTDKDKATVILSADKLAILWSTINQTLEAVEDWELHARTGANRKELEEIHTQLKSISNRINSNE